MHLPLSSEVCARAIIGASRALNVNPVMACKAKGGTLRLPLTVAAHVVMDVCEIPGKRAMKLFRLNSGGAFYSAPQRLGAAFENATRSARAEISKVAPQ